jgi:adenosylcobyric acid synthase
VIIPGTKSTIADLRFLKAQGWDRDIAIHRAAGKPVIGLCGGYQMLGRSVTDPDGTEGPPGEEEGLGLLEVRTVLEAPKTVRSVVAQEAGTGLDVRGYEIHCGRTEPVGEAEPFLSVGDEVVGLRSTDGLVIGSYVHGLFLDDRFRVDMLDRLGLPVAGGASYADSVDGALDALAAALQRHLDLDAMFA